MKSIFSSNKSQHRPACLCLYDITLFAECLSQEDECQNHHEISRSNHLKNKSSHWVLERKIL